MAQILWALLTFRVVEADEPLHLHVVAPNEEALESGTKQCEDLLKHVRTEMNK